MKIMFEKHSQLSIDFDNHDFIEDRQKKMCLKYICRNNVCWSDNDSGRKS